MAAQRSSALAQVIPLPTAASEPVQQTPRRGRYPKKITHISDARYKRWDAGQKERAAKELEFAQNMTVHFHKLAEQWHREVQKLLTSPCAP